MEEFSTIVGSAAVVTGIVQAIKLGGFPSQFAAVLALAIGIAAAFVFPEATIGVTVFKGIVIGLTSAGLYSGVRATAKI